MPIVEKLGSAKRFGARYGRKSKHKFAKIEKEQRRLHKCPYCNRIPVKRVAMGIWSCRKCNAKFAGKAYSLKKKLIVEEEKTELADKKPKADLKEEVV